MSLVRSIDDGARELERSNAEGGRRIREITDLQTIPNLEFTSSAVPATSRSMDGFSAQEVRRLESLAYRLNRTDHRTNLLTPMEASGAINALSHLLEKLHTVRYTGADCTNYTKYGADKTGYYANMTPEAVAKQIERDELYKLDQETIKQNKTCAICMAGLEKTERITILYCNGRGKNAGVGHAFHAECIKTWILESTKKKVLELNMARGVLNSEGGHNGDILRVEPPCCPVCKTEIKPFRR